MKVVLGLAVLVAAIGAMPAAAMAGSISGTVTAEVGGAPISGVEVCATPEPYTFEVPCVETNASGAYTVGGLPGRSYYLRFSGDRHNLDYVNEFHGDTETFPGDPVTIGDGEAKTGIDAALGVGGRIAGTVTDAGTDDPVASFLVCAFAPTATGEVGRCTRTDASGDYTIRGLPEEEYKVEFLSENEVNYITQYWEGSEDYFDSDPVSVTLGATTADIDAELNPGVEISGALTEAGSGKPVADVAVSLLDSSTEEVLDWVNTDSSGNYAFRGQPAGTYVVAFSRPRWLFGDSDGFSTQYYEDATEFVAATPLAVAPPEDLTGIDGEVVSLLTPPELPRETITVTPQPEGNPPLRCKKGFRKRKVRGKVRCVKVKKPRRGTKNDKRR